MQITKKTLSKGEGFSTQDESVLELLYKDLLLLYDLRIPLTQEGLSNYPINPHFLRDKRTNTLLQ